MKTAMDHHPWPFSFIRSSENIVNTYIIEVSKCTEHLRRNKPLTAFIVGVGALWNIYCLTHLLLREIRVLAQVTDPLIFLHDSSPNPV